MKTMTKKLKFFSMYDYDSEGTMNHLLKGANMEMAEHVNDADIIVFNGGSDIATSLYHEIPISRNIPEALSQRDTVEREVFIEYSGSDKLLVGICRGAQLLNVLNGGKLWQDVNNHNRDHEIRDLTTGQVLKATSTHHQMMRPNMQYAEIIAVADEATRKSAEKDSFPLKTYDDDHADTEIVWYGNTNCLCIQGHPEYVPGSAFANYSLNLMAKYLEEVYQHAHA